MKNIKRALLSILLLPVFIICSASDGMWLPQLLEKLNESEMRSLGMKISAKDIYNINGSSLKDAVLSFGGFCTGEVVSSKGLVLTNHHCGFDQIQNNTTLEHNYLRDGFWAMNRGQEIPCEGLFVTFIVRIDDVTQQVMAGVSASMSESERQSVVNKNIEELRKIAKKESYQDMFIRGFFEANQYYQFITETYRDIRLVGAPPSAIGNFGVDTDNWIWPRHTGDFSMFRIYAGKDNKPAAFSQDNIPYTPKRSLSVSLDGVKEGDFTMVFGFPGRTNEYLHSSAVDQVMTVNDPAKIMIRETALNILKGFMRRDEHIKIQYASKYAGIENAYKKWQGEVLGLTRANAVEKKKAYEAEFQKRVNANPQWKTSYGSLLSDLSKAYDELSPFGLARDYYTEIMSKIELFTIAAQLNSLVTAYEQGGQNGYNQRMARVKAFLPEFYKEYDANVDKTLFASLMKIYAEYQEKVNISPMFKDRIMAVAGDKERFADRTYNDNELLKEEKIKSMLNQQPEALLDFIKNNNTVKLFADIQKTYQVEVQSTLNRIQDRINELQRKYMEAQMVVFKEKKFFPDANSTLRVAYGNVKGYQPRDAVFYDHHSYLEGVMEKYKPGDYEFDVPAKLMDLYHKKDYGRYSEAGKMPVCFIAANHTTGGNSGSPALDAYGNLIGINFDRVWEGTMSDIYFDPSLCRNIMVDIRYVLFIIDKYAGAGHLVAEMKLVHPKKK